MRARFGLIFAAFRGGSAHLRGHLDAAADPAGRARRRGREHVLAAFMGGLALGSALGGRYGSRLPGATALRIYAGLELAIAVLALSLPIELRAVDPLLESAYADGAGGATFALLRVTASLVLLSVPAAAMGATFPIASRWYRAARRRRRARCWRALRREHRRRGHRRSAGRLRPVAVARAVWRDMGRRAPERCRRGRRMADGSRPAHRRRGSRRRPSGYPPEARRWQAKRARRAHRTTRAGQVSPARPRRGRSRALRLRLACPAGRLDARPRAGPGPDDVRVQHDGGDLHRGHRGRRRDRVASRARKYGSR